MKKFNLSLFMLFFILSLIAAGLIGYRFFFKTPASPDLPTLTIGQAKIFVEIAKTSEEKAQGLSNRSSLPENQGMLFVYGQSAQVSFWMKETLIPLDFVWINEGQVVELTANVQPKDYQPPKTLKPQAQVDTVLEINAGMIEKLGIKVGDQVSFESS